MTKEKQIALYMEKLDLTYEEALEMWQDEQDDNLPDLTPEQAKVVKQMTQGDRKKETKPRVRERKPDDVRRGLMNDLCEFLSERAENVVMTNIEREIEFIFNGEKYRLTLAKPRKEKK